LRRAEIGDYLRRHRRHILIVEGLTLALFVFDLLIRLGNPDLWHPAFGGEKPMVFSFFNAVLKSTYFPPYDPWLAGGYIHYYYYGFVVVALLTKLLGLVPAFAYNLILPMLFSLLGVNAFCVAYNLVKARKAHEGNPAPRETILTTQTLEWATEVVQSANTAPAAEVETPTPLSGAQAVVTMRMPTRTPQRPLLPITAPIRRTCATWAACGRNCRSRNGCT